MHSRFPEGVQAPKFPMKARMEFYDAMMASGLFGPSDLKVAWMLLYRHMNAQTGRCDPSIPTLAEETGFSDSTVQRALRKFKLSGWWSIGMGSRCNGGHTNAYAPLFDVAAKLGKRGSTGDTSVVAPVTPKQCKGTDVREYSDTIVSASRKATMHKNPPSRLLRRVEKLFEGDGRTKAGSRSLGAQWFGILQGSDEDLETVIERLETYKVENGYIPPEVWIDEMEEMGAVREEFAPKPRQRRKASPKPKTKPMPSFSEMRQARKTAVKVDFKTAWRDPRLRHHALEYGRGRGLSDKEINQHFNVYEGRNEDLFRNDWLLNWTSFLSRRLRPAPANPWAMSRY